MNRAIEIHDMEVLAMRVDGGSLVLELDVFVHCSEGRPGIDRGTGGMQAAELAIADHVLVESPATLPFWITDGAIDAGPDRFDNVFPFPFERSGPIRVELIGEDPRRLIVTGSGASLTLKGNQTTFEEFDPVS